MFLDEDEHICCEDCPYQCMDAKDHLSREFLFYSKHGDWRDQKFDLNEDGTIALRGNPKFGTDPPLSLGTDSKEKAVKYVRDLEREAREDAMAEEADGADDMDEGGLRWSVQHLRLGRRGTGRHGRPQSR